MRKEQVTAQLYTLRDFCKTAEDLLDSCQKLQKIGYTAVQVSGIGPIPPERVREIMDQCGMKIVVTHIGWGDVLNDPMKLIRMHQIYGTSDLGIGAMPGEYWGSYENQIAFAKQFVKQAPVFKEHGMNLSYHNHSFEFTRFPEGVPIYEMADIFMEGGVKFILDLYWVQAGGASPADWLRKVKGHINVAHYKDMTVRDNHSAMAEIGEGNMNYKEIVRVSDEIGLQWAAIEQDTCYRDPMESMAISYQNMMKLIG